MDTKKVYTRPELKVHGSVEQITQAVKKAPSSLDKDYPTSTPFSKLTWS